MGCSSPVLNWLGGTVGPPPARRKINLAPMRRHWLTRDGAEIPPGEIREIDISDPSNDSFIQVFELQLPPVIPGQPEGLNPESGDR
jgi:hypothetical protein